MIRPAKLTDALAIAEVHVSTWQQAYRNIVPDTYLQSLSIEKHEERWYASIERGSPELWVALNGSQIVGWVAFGPSRDEDATANTGEIEAIYVLPTHWSSGAGRELWLLARRRLIERGFRRVTLWVLTENMRAIRFYKSAGFDSAQSSLKELSIAGKRLNEVRYETNIG